MTVTNKHLAWAGVGLAAVGVALEWQNLFPATVGPRPLAKRGGTTSTTGKPVVSATNYTTGRTTPYGTTTSGGLSLGATLGGLTAGLAATLARLTGSQPTTDRKAGSSSGTAPSAPGGSAGSVNAGRSAPYANERTPNAG